MAQVTIIVPTYNTEKYISRCIDSVMKQTCQDFQLIILDGGSKDNTISRCLKYTENDNRVIVVNQKGLSLGGARNLGIKMAETDYVTFLDSDDWWSEDYLDSMLKGTENGNNDVVLCDINFVNEFDIDSYESNISALRLPAGKVNFSRLDNALGRCRTFAWGKLYRRSLFQDFEILEPHHPYEDVATTPYLLVKAKSIYHIPKALYFYVRNRQGSGVHSFDQLYYLPKSLEKLFSKFKEDNTFSFNYEDLRSLCWGQFCFLQRTIKNRFSTVSTLEKNQVINSMEKITFANFPELSKVSKATFCIYNNLPLFLEAVKHVVFDENKITSENADFVIVEENDIINQNPECDIIRVATPKDSLDDKETASWNLADEIFQKLF